MHHSKAVASIESADDDKFGPNGGFTAILSTPSQDRDGDRLGRTEWMEPLPDRLPLDVDHGMTVADTIGSFHPYFEGDKLMMDAYFSSLPKAQEVRTLIKEGHIDSVSVAFMTDKSKKDGQPNRELLNAGVVGIPSNRDAKILASKAFSALKDASEVLSPDEMKEVGSDFVTRKENLAEAYENLVAGQLAAFKSGMVKPEDHPVSPNSGVAGIGMAALLETFQKDGKEPYGNVEYADPGYRDGQKRYPIDTAEHVRAAWSYINQEKNASEYSPEQLDHIKSKIRAAAEKFGIHIEGAKSVDDAETDELPSAEGIPLGEWLGSLLKSLQTKSAGNGDAALIQAIHDAASHLGAMCMQLVADENAEGEDAPAKNEKSAVSVATTEEVSGESESEMDLDEFNSALAELTDAESPAEEAAAATEEVPAPADEAAEAARRTAELECLLFDSEL